MWRPFLTYCDQTNVITEEVYFQQQRFTYKIISNMLLRNIHVQGPDKKREIWNVIDMIWNFKLTDFFILNKNTVPLWLSVYNVELKPQHFFELWNSLKIIRVGQSDVK